MRSEALEDLLQSHGRVLGLLASGREDAPKRLLGAGADALLHGADGMLAQQRIDARAQSHDLGFDSLVQVHRFGSFGGVAIPKVAAWAGRVRAALGLPTSVFAPLPSAGRAV